MVVGGELLGEDNYKYFKNEWFTGVNGLQEMFVPAFEGKVLARNRFH
jgi:hypothetical protein